MTQRPLPAHRAFEETLLRKNDQFAKFQDNLGTVSGAAASGLGIVLGIPPLVDFAIGIAVDIGINNMPEMEVKLNPGDRIIITNSATTIRSTSTSEGSNGIMFNTSVWSMSKTGIKTLVFQSYNFFSLSPVEYSSHNDAMKRQENAQNGRYIITNPNYISTLNLKLVRTN